MAAFPVLSVQGTTCVKHANQWRFIAFNALAPLFVVNTWRCFMLAAEAFNWTGVLVLLASNKNGYWISNKTRLSCLEWERPIIPRHGIVTNGGMTYVFDRNDIITNWIERSPPMHLFRCARVAHFTHFRFLPWSDNTNHNCIYRMRATAALSFMRIAENNRQCTITARDFMHAGQCFSYCSCMVTHDTADSPQDLYLSLAQ